MTKKGKLKQSMSADEIAALKGEPSSPSINLNDNSGVNNSNLSAEDNAIIMQAKEAQNKMNMLGGIQGNMPNVSTMPPPNDTYLEINGIPSGSIFYDNQVYGQPLQVKDLLLIQSMDDSNIVSRFNQIFKRRLWGINPSEILLIDELFFALWLRATSFDGYSFPAMPFTCNKCAYKVKPDESEFNWGDITWEIDDLELISEYHKNGYYETVLPDSKIPVKIYLRKRKHLEMIENIVKEDFLAYDNVPSEEYHELLVMSAVIDMGAEDIKQTAAYVQELTPIDFITLIKEINKVSLDSTPIANCRCPKCQEVNPVKGYPFRPEIYLPVNT